MNSMAEYCALSDVLRGSTPAEGREQYVEMKQLQVENNPIRHTRATNKRSNRTENGRQEPIQMKWLCCGRAASVVVRL